MLNPLQMGFPGVAELVIILMLLFVVGLPLLAVVAVGIYFLTRDGDETAASTTKDERIAELEAEVTALREQVGDRNGDTDTEREDGDDDPTAT